MNRVLLVDAACSRCKGLAAEIRQQSDGLLDVRSLSDAHMQGRLDRARPDWRREPTLMEVEEDAVRVFTGLALRTRLITVLGLRRAWRIAELIARSQTDLFTVSESRRTILRRGASVAASVAGLALLGPSPRWSGTIPVASADKDKDKDKDKGKKPGKYARKYGIESWEVDKTGDGFKVKFEHEKKKYSGKIDVSYGGGGKTFTSILKRDNDRFQMAFSGDRLAGTDSRGDRFTATWDRQRERWDVSRDSEKVMQDNERDFLISFAIAADLQDRAPSAKSAASLQVAAAQTRCCRCSPSPS